MKKRNKSLLLCSLSLLIIWLLNKILFFIPTMKNKLHSYNSHYYQWRFGKIFYTKQGKGHPLLLVHDLSTMGSDYEWHKLIKELQKNYTVFTLDLLGCGRSEKPKITYTSYLYVQLITDFIKHVIQKPTHIIVSGYSTSFITMACYQSPYSFDKIMLINPNHLNHFSKGPRKRHQLNKKLIELPVVGTLLYNILHSRLMIRKQLILSFYKAKNIKRKHIDIAHESAHLGGEHAKYLFASQRNLYTNITITHALKQLNNSIYLVTGEYADTTIKEEYLQANPSIESAMIKNSKLLPQIETPKQIIELCHIYFNTHL